MLCSPLLEFNDIRSFGNFTPVSHNNALCGVMFHTCKNRAVEHR